MLNSVFLRRLESVELLVRSGAELIVADRRGQTALVLAAKKDDLRKRDEARLEIVRLLIENGAQLDTKAQQRLRVGNGRFENSFS